MKIFEIDVTRVDSGFVASTHYVVASTHYVFFLDFQAEFLANLEQEQFLMLSVLAVSEASCFSRGFFFSLDDLDSILVQFRVSSAMLCSRF